MVKYTNPDLTLPAIENAEHIDPGTTGDNIAAKKVASYKWDTANSQWIRAGLAQTERYDYSGSPVIYVGSAPLGTAVSVTGWTINKFDLTTSSAATGLTATDVSWNNRASGTYN